MNFSWAGVGGACSPLLRRLVSGLHYSQDRAPLHNTNTKKQNTTSHNTNANQQQNHHTTPTPNVNITTQHQCQTTTTLAPHKYPAPYKLQLQKCNKFTIRGETSTSTSIYQYSLNPTCVSNPSRACTAPQHRAHRKTLAGHTPIRSMAGRWTDCEVCASQSYMALPPNMVVSLAFGAFMLCFTTIRYPNFP